MKSIIAILCATLSLNAAAQDIVQIELKNGKPEVTKGNATDLIIPFTVRFKVADFNEKEIVFMNSQKEAIPGSKKKFGTDIKTNEEDKDYYSINVDFNEDKVVASCLGDTKLPNSSLIFKVLNTEFPISYKMKKKKEDTKIDDKPQSEEKYTAGYIYYDAIALVSNTIPDSTKLKIYTSYGYQGTDDNPYLQPFYKEISGTQVLSTDAVSFLSNFGNLDVTYFAAGLARFLAERTKEELNEAFFSKMKEQLNTYPELTTAFPKTLSFLNQIETFSYASILNSLKDAFEMDVQNLPTNLYNVKSLKEGDCDKVKLSENDSKSCHERLKKLTEFFDSQDGRWVALGMYSVKEAIQSTNPAVLMNAIVSSTEFSDLKTGSTTNNKYEDYNIASSMELSNFISQSLISKEDKQVWISSTQLNSLFKTKDAFKVYLGLLLSFEIRAKDKKVIDFYKPDNSKISFGDVLKEAYKNYTNYEPQVSSLIKNSYTAYNIANNAVKKMIAASEKSVEADPQALYDYYRSFTSSLKQVAYSPILKTITGKDIGATYYKAEQFLNPSVDIAYHISTKKYSAAIYDASILLSSLNDVVDADKHPVFKPITKSFVKYGTLISTVANAQSSEEVKQALDASVLPVGSYSIKRKTSWSMSINSYVGAFWSFSNTANTKDYLPALGLAAPIGFNISKGFCKSGNGGGLSLNLQILDVGALVNYYLLKGDTATIANDFKVQLSNIFSPGFNLCYNIPMTPLSLAFGGQYIPTLYKYEQINGTDQLRPTNAWRWQLSLLVDIPMYNLKVWDFNE